LAKLWAKRSAEFHVVVPHAFTREAKLGDQHRVLITISD